MASESITHSAIDSGPIRARGIIVKYRRVVPIHGHVFWNLKREVSRSNKEFKIAIIFRRRSRENSLFHALYHLKALNKLQRRKGWICESKCKVNEMIVYIFLRNILTLLSPYPSATTVYARSAFCMRPAFYFQSAVCILHAVCILPLVHCSLQSAVRRLRFTLTGFICTYI